MNRPRLFLFPSPYRIGVNICRNCSVRGKQILGLLKLFLLTVTIAGCSNTTFVYNRLDWLLPWYVEGFTELNRDQERYLDAQLVTFLGWHRESELPCYLGLIDHIDASVKQEVTPEEVKLIATAFEGAWLRTQDESLNWLLSLGEQLSQEQIEDFLEELEEKRVEDEEEYLGRSDEEFQQDNYQTLRDIAEDYLGKLQQPQREQLREVSKTLRRSDILWMEGRVAFQQRLAEVLEREPGWQLRARELVETRFASAPEEYQVLIDYNSAVIHEWLASLLNGRTEKQNERLQKKLEKLRGQIQTLATQAEDSSTCAVGLI